MQRNLTVILFIIILRGYCLSQNDWSSGYIISNQKDTIYGFIDSRNSNSNSKQCYFKKGKQEKTQIFSPQELVGYRFNDGRFYISKSIGGSEIKTPVFFEFLFQGIINVYHTQDNADRYFVEKDSILYELKNTEVLKRMYGTEAYNQNMYSENLIEKKEYIGILSALLNDAEIQPDIMKCKLKTESLIEIAKKYHEKVCGNEKCIIYEKIVKPLYITKGIHTGVSMNTINFGNELVSDYSFAGLLGFRFELENALAWNENLSVVLDFTLQRFSNYKLMVNNNSNYNIEYNNVKYMLSSTNAQFSMTNKYSLNVDIKTIALKIPFTINYTFSKGKIRPYIGTGIENMIILSQNNHLIYRQFYSEYNNSIPTYQVGLVEKAGSKYMLKKQQLLYLEFNYELINNLNMNQFLRFTNNIFSLTFGYAF
jgi:hypothetical protein